MVDWHEFMAVAGFALAIGLTWEVVRLRRHLHLDDLTPRRKWKRAIAGEKYRPSNSPDDVPRDADPHSQRFLWEFRRAAEYLNSVYADSPWSFQDTWKPAFDRFGEGASRLIVIRYNQQPTGEIEIACWKPGAEGYVGDIRIKLSLINARLFPARDVAGLCEYLAILASNEPETVEEARRAANSSMIDAVWQVGDDATGNPELNFNVKGRASWFRSSSWAMESQIVQ